MATALYVLSILTNTTQASRPACMAVAFYVLSILANTSFEDLAFYILKCYSNTLKQLHAICRHGYRFLASLGQNMPLVKSA